MTATVIELDQEGPAAILRIAGDITSASEADLDGRLRPRGRERRDGGRSSTSASSST